MSAPDSWELVITSTGRIALERALERLLGRDAALLRAAIDGTTPRLTRVHLQRSDGTARCGGAVTPDVDHAITDDPLAATCVACKRMPESVR